MGGFPAKIDQIAGFSPLFFGSPSLQFEAAWVLTNKTSKTTQRAPEFRAVPYLRELIESDDQDVCDQALWALGCVIGQYPILQKSMVRNGTVDALLQRIDTMVALPFLKNSVNIIGLLLEEHNTFWLSHDTLQHKTIEKLLGKFVANKFKLMSSEGQTSYFLKLSPQFTKEAMACTYF